MFTVFGLSENKLYDYINLLSILMFVFGNLSRLYEKQLCFRFQYILRKDSDISQHKVDLFLVLEIFLLSLLQGAFISIFNTQFGNIVGTGANYYGLLIFSPILVIILSLILCSSPLKQLDFITPTYPLALFISKLACFCCGCCTGIPWPYGYLNSLSRLVEFPAQLLESLVALLLFQFMHWYQKRGKTGTCFPVYLISYSATRFFTEFLRVEDNVFGFLKTYQIICLASILVGILAYLFAILFGNRITRFYDERFPSHIGCMNYTTSTASKQSKRILPHFILYLSVLLMLIAILGKYYVAHLSLFTGFVIIAVLAFFLLQKKLFPEIEIWKLVTCGCFFSLTTIIINLLIPFKDMNHFHTGSAYFFILLVPIFALLLKPLHIPYKTLLSFSVLSECLLIIIRKSSCFVGACCIGKYIPSHNFEFPSHVAELAAIIILFLFFLRIIQKFSVHSSIYAWFMLIYGIVQFILVDFIYEKNPSLWNVSTGRGWPFLLVCVATIWLLTEFIYRKYVKKNSTC